MLIVIFFTICHGTRSGGSVNVVALTIVHDRILHKGAKRCEGTSTLYTVGCQGSLRAARPESVTGANPFLAAVDSLVEGIVIKAVTVDEDVGLDIETYLYNSPL